MRVCGLVLITFLVSCGSGKLDQKTLKVACAANMQVAMDSIAILFEAEHNIHCDITTGSSGMLTSQIENGAPYDLFVSANIAYPNALYEKGKGEKPHIYGRGKLIFVVDKEATYTNIKEALEDKNISRIGLANRETAPYGMAAHQYLEMTGILTQINDKMVIGESVGQVNQYLATEAVDAGFTSYSFKVKNKENYRFFNIEADFLDPIDQSIMILNEGLENNSTESEELLTFFSSTKCKNVLNYFGYLTD